jgi:hypothetical protein
MYRVQPWRDLSFQTPLSQVEQLVIFVVEKKKNSGQLTPTLASCRNSAQEFAWPATPGEFQRRVIRYGVIRSSYLLTVIEN